MRTYAPAPLVACGLVVGVALVVRPSFALLAAQQPAQQQPAPVFTSRVDLVTLDVTVVDKDGHPVTGLTANDFIITLDKQRRPVQLLDYQSFGGPATTNVAAGAAAGQVSNTRDTAKAGRGGRVVLFMFDDLSFRPGDGKGFIAAAERALDQFGFDDLVGVVTSSGLGPVIDPTRDRRVITAAFHDKRLVGRYDDDPAGYYIAVNDSNAVVRECGLSTTAIAPPAGKTGGGPPVDETCPQRVIAALRMFALATGHRAASQLAAYSAAIRALGAGPAPRVLIVVSGGIAYGGNPFADTATPTGIAREATEAGVQFFVLSDASDPTELAFPGVCPTVECNYLRAQARREERRFLINGLDSIANEAGGQLLRTIGTPDRFYTRIIEQTSGLYRLGVAAPAGANTNRFLSATVKVNRPGVTVLANRHALLPSVAATPVSSDDALKSRLALGGAAFGVPIALATARRHDPAAPTQVQLGVNVELPANTPGPVVAMFSLVSGAGHLVRSGRQTLATPERGRDYRTTFALPIGEDSYQLRLAVADATGNIGSVEQSVTGQLSRLGALVVSDLFTTWSGDDNTQYFLALERLPSAAKILRTSLELYPDNPAAAASVVVRLTVKKNGDLAPVLTRNVTPALNGGALTAAAEIPVSALAPAMYTIEATVLVDGRPVGSVFQFVRKTD